MTSGRPARLLALAALCAASPALAAEGVLFSGSAYVDYWGIPDSAAASRSPQSFAPATSIKIGIDINDDLSFSAKACIGCHGIDLEHVALDYQPKPWFNVQAGRIAVPFGDFSNRVDPSSYKTASPPLLYDMGRMAYGTRSAMNLGVLPLPYVDTGALVYGMRWFGERVQLWYGAWAVAGLRGSNDLDWMAMRSIPYNDNNREPSGGGRLVLSFSSDPGRLVGDSNVGASYTGGRYDKEARLWYHVVGADATFRIWRLVVRGEWAMRRTDLDAGASGYPYALEDAWFRKEGFYGEVELPLARTLAGVYRYEELRRTGAPLPGSIAELTPDSRMTRHTAGLVVTPASAIFLKLSWEYWDTTDFGRFHTYHAGVGGAF